MSRDRSLLEDELPPDIGREALLAAVSHTTVLVTPVGNRIPSQIGERVFLAPTKQFFTAKGLTNADWFAENAAS